MQLRRKSYQAKTAATGICVSLIIYAILILILSFHATSQIDKDSIGDELMDYLQIKKNFERHGFTTQLFASKEDARDYLAGILQNQTIGFGGSETLKEIGLYEALEKNNVVIWHNKVPGTAVRKLANCCQVYITSANAITKTGEILNIDCTGNRVAMTAFGPKFCYYIVGKNKITATISEAYSRCKNVAAPLNARRLGVKTPCAVKPTVS